MTKPNKEQTEFTEADQEQRDKLLRKLLKTPPQPRPKRERAKAERRPEPTAKTKLAK